jgi:hypothetical protein
VVGVVAGEDCFVNDVAQVAMPGGLRGFARGSDGVLTDEVAEGKAVFVDDLAVAFFLDVHQRSQNHSNCEDQRQVIESDRLSANFLLGTILC